MGASAAEGTLATLRFVQSWNYRPGSNAQIKISGCAIVHTPACS